MRRYGRGGARPITNRMLEWALVADHIVPKFSSALLPIFRNIWMISLCARAHAGRPAGWLACFRSSEKQNENKGMKRETPTDDSKYYATVESRRNEEKKIRFPVSPVHEIFHLIVFGAESLKPLKFFKLSLVVIEKNIRSGARMEPESKRDRNTHEMCHASESSGCSRTFFFFLINSCCSQLLKWVLRESVRFC